jgi:hypothetical protein
VTEALTRRFFRDFVVATDMKHAATRDLYCYWDRLRGSRTAPERVDIDPAAIRRILGDTFIVEVEQSHAFPFRLAGTRLCAMMGHELRGTSLLDRWTEADRQEMERLLGAVSDDSAAVVVGAEGQSNQGHTLDLELLMLPLRHRGKTHSRILGSLTPGEAPYWIGICPLTRLSIRSIRILWPSSREPILAAPPVKMALPEGMRRIGHLTIVEGGKSLSP